MKQILAVIIETFTLLRRDRVFIPAIVLAVFIFLFASLASRWGIEEYEKFLYDVGFAGYSFMGCIVALFWGTKLLSDSRSDGSIEIQVASPISRSLWIVGKYLGLALTLLFLGLVLLLLWQGFVLIRGFPLMEASQLITFLLFTLEWLVVAALAVSTASAGSQGTAIFSSLCLWIAGLTSLNIANAMPPNTPEASKLLLETIAKFWDFQRFNLSDVALVDGAFPTPQELGWRLGYGMGLIMLFIALACLSFHKRDVTA